ncbi:MAG: trypsin-like peptidase domain-containing protein [Ruminococcus sp.]|nr:trypsin-like peptidase domain-containing protein [Ruminococcus sp.]
MNEYNNINLDNNSPKPRKHVFRKAAAFLMAMVLVSGGSVAVYRQFAENEYSGNTSVSEERSDNKNNQSSSLSAKGVSFIEKAESDGTVLTTEETVQKLLPSVVGIESQFTVTSMNNGYYYGFGNMPSTSGATGTGTGVVITENGYIVTNAHVIYDSEHGAGLADSIKVYMNDDNSYDAEVVGYDTDCDLAVLKIEADGLTAAEFGDSDGLMLGESVIAIGNPLGFDLMNTVTSGIVSGLNRNITINDKAMNLIQTDTAINEGNSGGPLINKKGQVIGINSSKMSASYGSASIEGIGFAIPSNEVSQIIDDLMEYGYVTGKPQLGISCQDVTDTISQMYNMPIGIYVTDVSGNSAADKAGLQSGDVIIAVDDTEVSTSEELNAQKNKHSAGDTIEITYIRNGKEKTTEVVLDEVKQDN